MEDPDWRKMMLTLIAVVVAIVLLISLILAMRYRPPKSDRAAILYRRFVKKSGVAPRTGETPALFAARASTESSLPASSIGNVTETYLEARYGPPSPAVMQQLESAVATMHQR